MSKSQALIVGGTSGMGKRKLISKKQTENNLQSQGNTIDIRKIVLQ